MCDCVSLERGHKAFAASSCAVNNALSGREQNNDIQVAHGHNCGDLREEKEV